jgi:(E)-4-hydroxy-3-methylbut-2-enyl-diphosphate synthase
MKIIQRRQTREIAIGQLKIGGENPLLIQSMLLVSPHNWKEAIDQIVRLEESGCDLVRIAVPTREDAGYLRKIKEACHVPLVADIHFDPLLAIIAIEQGVDKIRLNPSNIKDKDMIKPLVLAAKERGIPIRIGANSGSLRRHESTEDAVNQLFGAILHEKDILNHFDFDDIVLSAKSSSLEINESINRKLSSAYDYPLHLGLTEAGTLVPGIVKSTIGLLPLLRDGIGDTIRLSLAGELEAEVYAAKTLLQELGLKKGVHLISCPMCGRAKWDSASVAGYVTSKLAHYPEDISIAIMGCEVNGPGEARDADIGLAGSGEYVVLFELGQIVDKGSPDAMVEKLLGKLDHRSH